jgi:hypothetical protein
MMGRLNHDQGQLFYSFSLEEVVPDDHLVRKVAAVLDLSWGPHPFFWTPARRIWI